MAMNHRTIYLVSFAVAVIFFSACGEGFQKSSIIIEGAVDVTAVKEEIHGPVMVAVMRLDNTESSESLADLDIEQVLEHPGDYFVEYFSVDSQDLHFSLDITESGLRPGDKVVVFAFVANNYSTGVIAPKIGDVVGIGTYDSMDNTPLAHEITTGVNEVNVKIDREFVDLESQISGRIENLADSAPMDVYVIAYIAENRITTIDFSNDGLEFDGVIGYFQKKDFTSGQNGFLDYTIDVIPYLPYRAYDKQTENIDNVSIFVWLDVNQNSLVDAPDFAGYYTNPESNLGLKNKGGKELQVPACLNIRNQKFLSGIDIRDWIALSGVISNSNPSQSSTFSETITLKGGVTLPDPAAGVDAPAYIIIAAADYAETMKSEPLEGLYYFNRIPTGRTDFEFEITDSRLQPGDEVMLVGLWDRDNQGWYPAVTKGDYVGFYFDMENLTDTYKLKAGVNSGISIDLSREVFSFEKEISGKMNIDINTYPNATATIIAYAGELNSMDIRKLNPEEIIGITKLRSGGLSTDGYSLSVFPFGRDLPIENVCLYAILDEESDGQPEKIGYYTHPEGDPQDSEGLWPAILSLAADHEEKECDITFFESILLTGQPSRRNQATPAEITCRFDLPIDTGTDASPIFAAVFDLSQADFSDLFSPDKMLKKIKYLQKIPSGENTFTISKDAGIYRGDEILITVFQDLDYNGCYPRPTPGDSFGYYYDMNKFGALTVKLEDQGIERDGAATYQFGFYDSERFEFNRTYYDHQAVLKFNINNIAGYVRPKDPIVILAIQGNFLNMINFGFGSGLSINWQDVDLDRIVAYDRTEILPTDADSCQYEIKLLPFLSPNVLNESIDAEYFDVIENVFLFVIDEAPGSVNGLPDPGEFIGYYHSGFVFPVGTGNVLFPRLQRLPQPIDIPNQTTKLPGSVFAPGRKPLEIP